MSKSDERIAKMNFSSIYPYYLKKIETKGRTRNELNQVISWLTAFDEDEIQEFLVTEVSFKDFFEKATINKNASLISGVICGCRIEEIQNPLTKKVRYLDKLVDELAKGLKMERILRTLA